jgi:transglutaminase/protease-like cytokinesis protein 3
VVKIKQYRTWRAFQAYDGWQLDYAYEFLTKKKGNCYNYAAAFAVLAKAVGYDAYTVRGRCRGNRDRAGDGMTRHAWVRIGTNTHYDPEIQAIYGGGMYGRKGAPPSRPITAVEKIY